MKMFLVSKSQEISKACQYFHLVSIDNVIVHVNVLSEIMRG
jgi:hypothetical protein